MNKCPKCDRYSLEYFSAAHVARCLFCGYLQKVASRDEFFSLFPNGRRVTNGSQNLESGKTRPTGSGSLGTARRVN